MIHKRLIPESFNYGMPAVELIGCGSRGMDKQAMVKRASAFDAGTLGDIKSTKDRTFLHVITTGAFEKFASNLNGDAFNESSFELVFPMPEDPKVKSIVLDGGLKKYHDSTYMDNAAVYQEHDRKDDSRSGEIIAARYNDVMHRGELIIAVDTGKWARRLQAKASGHDIYLSMGCSVPFDICTICGRRAKVEKEHCDHFRKLRCLVMDDGTQVCVMNDAPRFDDISGVDIPADRIAFVLRKIASGSMAKTAAADALQLMGSRTPMPYTKAAMLLRKLSAMEKQIDGVVEGDTAPEFQDDAGTQKEFVVKVCGYPSGEVIAASNRHGILLSPGMLFKLLGQDCPEAEGMKTLSECDDWCCGDCSAMLRELECDDGCRNTELLDGSFDATYPVDISLDGIVSRFAPMLSMSNPAVAARSVHIIITGQRPERQLVKSASFNVQAQEALRRTYARYFISFASQNDEPTCLNALRKAAGYGKSTIC